jgi:hypothetical protein
MGIVINLAEVRLLRERQRMWRELKKYVQERHERILWGVDFGVEQNFHIGETHDDTDSTVAD